MLIEQLTGQTTTHLVELEKHIFIHQDVNNDFLRLQLAARHAGFNLQIASGFRSFDRQLAIWNNKFNGQRPVLDKNESPLDVATLSEIEKLHAILYWSALPGASRHHWGTDLDIYDPDLLPKNKSLQLTINEYTDNGYFSELTAWLTNNMAEFGFYRPYQFYQGGVACEPWHISYRSIANKALKTLTIDHIHDLIITKNIIGKSLICAQLPMIYRQYICNINQ